MVLALILIRQKTNCTLQIVVCKWVVPEKIHTSPPQRKFLLSGGGGEKKLFLIIVSVLGVLGHPKGGTGVCTTEYRKNLHVPYLLSNVYNMVPLILDLCY